MKNNYVLCLNDGNVFDTPTAACEFYQISQSQISKHLKGKSRFVKGLAFCSLIEMPSDISISDFRKMRLSEILFLKNFDPLTVQHVRTDNFMF